MNKSKKIISIVAAATLAFSTLALAGCGTKDYAGDTLSAGYDKTATVASNGGFAVEKGNYVYFINGAESNTADNTYGDVKKGALMRISKTELADANYDAAQIVIPSLLVAGDYTAGLFIYGEYVYYATPTSDKNPQTGVVENSYLDFRRSKLDGSEAPENYFLRLSNNSAKYRFVQGTDGTVYCMYEEDSKLKSLNVETGDITVLVSGAKSSFFYDVKNPTNPNVYYTMGVTYDVDESNPTSPKYDQLYCVNAATIAEAKTEGDKVSYTAKLDGKEVASYSFKKSYVEESENGDVKDYTTYPYVNLGSLVLDGVGSASTGADSSDTRFNKDNKADSTEPLGYNYTIQSYQNGGVYFTRTALTKTESDTENAKLFYLADERENWNTVKGNALVDVVALNTEKASSSALFEVAEDGTHTYYYADGSILKKATADANGVATTVNLAYEVSSPTLWKTEGDYLYYYSSASNGNNITRIKCTGSEDDYKQAFFPNDEYKPLTLPLVDWKSDWYKPEFVDVNGTTFVLYCNAQSYGAGSTAYNYVYATKMGTTAEIVANQEALDEVNEYIDNASDSQLQAVMDYYFKTGKTEAFDAVKDVKDLYDEDQKKDFDKFVAKFTAGEFAWETTYAAPISRMTEDDVTAIAQNWADSLLSEKEEAEDESGLPTWAIVLIVVGGVLVVAGATVAVLLYLKNKAEKAKKAEEVVNAYQRKKIDTTDDKSIDVYADEEAATETEEETVEEPVEETTEEVEEAPVEETAEAPVEEE